MSFIPKPQEIYKHFKGNLYQIIAIAEHTETGETLVVYQALYGDFRTYARPLEMFVSRVDRKKYPDVEQEFRFELQGPEAGRQKEAAEISERSTAKDQPVETSEKLTAENQAAEASERLAAKDRLAETSERLAAEDRPAEGREKAAENTASGEPEEELALDPMILEFLDTDDYLQRLNILAGLHHRITDDMITTMAIACDVEVTEGDTEERYESLKACLLTLQRYECNRLR